MRTILPPCTTLDFYILIQWARLLVFCLVGNGQFAELWCSSMEPRISFCTQLGLRQSALMVLITVSYLIHGWQWLEVTRSISARTIQRLRAGFASSRRKTFAMYSISHSRETLQEACESKIASFLLGSRSSWTLSSLSWGHIKGRRG